MIDLHRMAVWRAVVASGSVSGAASNLGYTPATISQHIISLQRTIGLLLYERRGRGIEPTAVGIRLAEESAELLASARRLEHFIEDLRSGPAPRLAIGSFASAAREWMPAVVVGLAADFPDVQLELDIHTAGSPPGGSARDIEIDDEVPMERPLTFGGYRRHELCVDDFILAVAADHPLAGREEVSINELRDEIFVDHDMHDRATGRLVRLACHSAGFEPRFTARSDDHYAVLAMVGAGVGVTMLPGLAKGNLPPDVCTASLVGPTPRRRIAMHVRDTSAHLPYVQAAMRLLEQRARRE